MQKLQARVMIDRGQNDHLKDWEELQYSRKNKQSHQQFPNSSNQLSSDHFNSSPGFIENNNNEWANFQNTGFNQPRPNNNKRDLNSNTSGDCQKLTANKDIFSSFDSNSSAGKAQLNYSNGNNFNMFEAFGFNQNTGNSGDIDNRVEKKWDTFDFNKVQQSNPQKKDCWNNGNWNKPNSTEFANTSVSFQSNTGGQKQLIQKPPTNQFNSFSSNSSQSSFNNQLASNLNPSNFSSPKINYLSNSSFNGGNNFDNNNSNIQKNNIVQDDLLGLSSGPSKSTNTCSILDVQF